MTVKFLNILLYKSVPLKLVRNPKIFVNRQQFIFLQTNRERAYKVMFAFISSKKAKKKIMHSLYIPINRFKNHSNDFWSRLIQKKSTFCKLCTHWLRSSTHLNEHWGQVRVATLYLNMTDCKIEENGVTPIPVAI